ncbi:hypothetical protein BDP27DRAFT_1427567 [Rhodocollybia butyracea]|uniref:Uncharacterized protein n=1 Tax=Rhodocollybia butyracea TaxID=206335 RepID=A0A9P5PFA3_9AGAR|nr:hypothetical protein BDP27DRAFT_1427567 [Rhodocollybia butyracea]
MQQPILFALLFVVFRFTSGQANCPSACFQGTIEDAGPAVSDSFCPVAAGIINPVLPPELLVLYPRNLRRYSHSFRFCTDGCSATRAAQHSAVTLPTFAAVQPKSHNLVPTRTTPSPKRARGMAMSITSLGRSVTTENPARSSLGFQWLLIFFMPELAEGALSLVTEGCGEIKGAQTISSDVSQVCNVWPTAGCGTVDAASSSGSSASASTSAAKSPFFDRQKAAYMISLVVISIGGLLAY